MMQEYDQVLQGAAGAVQKPAISYQQLDAKQKNAINAMLVAYALPVNHAPQIHQMMQAYVQQILQQTA